MPSRLVDSLGVVAGTNVTSLKTAGRIAAPVDCNPTPPADEVHSEDSSEPEEAPVGMVDLESLHVAHGFSSFPYLLE